MGVSFNPPEESEPVPCPGFEGFEKRLEVEFWDPLGFADPAGLRAIPRAELDAMLSAAECSVVAVLSNKYFDSYVLSESSLFVYPSKLVLKTCGTTQLLKAIPPLLASAALHAQLQACRCKYTRGSFIFPSSQPSPYGNFGEEVKVLERFFGHLGGGGRAYVLGEPSGTHNWHVYTAAAEVAPPRDDDQSFTLEMCMTQLERSAAAIFYKSPFYRSAGDMTLLSGIRGLLPHSEICDFAFDPCGYSMNSLQGAAHSTIHVTPEDGFSYASFETQGYNPRTVDLGSLVERVLVCFKPGVFSVSLSASGDARWQDAGSWGAPVAPRGYVCSGSSRREMPGGSLVVYHTYSRLHGGDRPVAPLPLFPALEKATAGGQKMMIKELHLRERKAAATAAVEVIGPGVRDMDEFMRKKIDSSGGREEAFYVVDLGTVARLWKLWRCSLPRVHPFYAVKCNPDPELLALLADLGAGFDVASKAELEAVAGLGVGADNLVFANPCKLPSHLTAAAGAGVLYTTFDSEGEVAKVKKFHPEAKLLLRLRADDAGARCQLGVKYGALPEECMRLLEAAMAAGVEVAGVAFHVGSGASGDGAAFTEGIRCARRVFDMAERLGMGRLRVLDIGGGFVSDGGSGANFSSAAYHINRALDEWFPEEMEVRVIAEPGRYFAEEATSLAALVFGCRRRNNAAEYWINDGIYGSMNCLLYDHASLSVRPLRVASLEESMREVEEVVDSVVFGPTCDGLDTVLSKVLLPRLECGDWLVFPRMGAYTKAAASTFNGFSVPSTTFYVHSGVPFV